MMDADYRIIRWNDIIKANPIGETDLEQSKQVIYDLSVMAQLSKGRPILLDLRETYSDLTPENVRELIEEYAGRPELRHSKLAFLARDDEQLNKVTLAEVFLNVEGFQVAAFTDYEKAITWLQKTKTTDDLLE